MLPLIASRVNGVSFVLVRRKLTAALEPESSSLMTRVRTSVPLGEFSGMEVMRLLVKTGALSFTSSTVMTTVAVALSGWVPESDTDTFNWYCCVDSKSSGSMIVSNPEIGFRENFLSSFPAVILNTSLPFSLMSASKAFSTRTTLPLGMFSLTVLL